MRHNMLEYYIGPERHFNLRRTTESVVNALCGEGHSDLTGSIMVEE